MVLKGKNLFLLVIFLAFSFFLVGFLSAGTAFNFAGYTKYQNATNMSFVNVTLEIYSFNSDGPPNLTTSISNLSDSTGFFNLTINSTYSNDSYGYKPVIIRYNGTAGNGTYANYVGQSLPDFGYEEFFMLSTSLTTFYLKEALTVDLSAIGLTHAASSITDISNVSFPTTTYYSGLEVVNLSGYGDGKFWAYLNSSSCLAILNSTYSVNMSFCSLNITNINDLTYTNLLNNEQRFYLLNSTTIEFCNLTASSSSINCTISYNISHPDFSSVYGIEYASDSGLFYVSGTNSTGTHFIHKYNSSFTLNASMDRPDYPSGKLEYYNNYLYSVGNKTGTGWVIYRCGTGPGDVCEDYSAISKPGENVTGLEYNIFDGKWYYASYLNNSIIEINDPFTSRFNFFYQIKDTALGYPIKETFSNGGSGVSSATFYLPTDKNYSLMIYPNNGPGFPAKVDLTNLTNQSNISLGGTVAGGRNATITTFSDGTLYLNLSNANMTTEFVQLTGYAKWNVSASQQNFTNFTILAYLIEGGNMVFKGATLPQNMGQWQWSQQVTDVFNTTSGFYNMTLPASVLGANLMLFANTQVNNSNVVSGYGGFRTVTLNYGETSSPTNVTVYPLLGQFSNLTLGFEGKDNAEVLNTTLKNFVIQNESGTRISQGHIEIELEYPASSFSGSNISFSWMGDLGADSNGSVDFPLLNYSIKKIQVFSSQYAPRQKALSLAELQNNPTYFNLSTFENKDPDSSVAFTDVEMMMYIHQDDGSCSVPYPAPSCYPIASAMNDSEFNPFSMVIGGGKLDFEMKKTSNNITVKYVNVDLLASGPPDAMFDDSASSSTSGNVLEEAWKFGSEGPEIYDYILIAAPYTEGSSSQTGINESADVKINITKLYGEDFATSWQQGTNSTSNLSDTDYADYITGSYLNYLNGTGVLCNSSDVNLTSGICYKDTTHNLLWFKIPHFSGIGPEVTGSAITASSSSSSSSSGGGSISSGGATYIIANSDFARGYNKNMAIKDKLKFNISASESHIFELTNLTTTTASVKVTSSPQIATLSIGETKKFELTGDNLYDLSVVLNKISLVSGNASRANITIKADSSEVTASGGSGNSITGAAVNEQGNAETGVTGESNKEKGNSLLLVLVIVAILAIVIIFVFVLYNKNKRRRRYMEFGF